MVRKLFLVATTLGLILNLYCDIVILTENKAVTESGDWVYHSYQVSQAIDAIKVSLLKSQLQKHIPENLHAEIQYLNSMVQDLPSQKMRADQLTELSQMQMTDVQFNQCLDLLAEMSAAESAILSMRMREDIKKNATASTKLIFANGMDLLLILLFLGFFFYERKIATQLQKNLTKALMDVESGSQKLQTALIEKSSKMKTTVHDLKNPLGSIRGFADLIYDEPGNRESTLKMAGIIQRISNSSLALVSALLAEEQQEVLPMKNFKLSECLQETCTFLMPIANEKNQKIKLDLLSTCFSMNGHRHQIQDVFFNVIGNALKFSPRGSIVHVEFLQQENDCVARVRDSGPGFTHEDLQNLFGRGVSLSAKPTGTEISTGLGLYSTKQIMDNVGGTIQIRNHPNGGACVSIRFPARIIISDKIVPNSQQDITV